jgi:hypothetical protein
MRPFFIIFAASAAALWTAAGTAQAQANRTFVSGHGSDSNPCSLSAPCRSFAQALTQTNAGGEITILDPAGYGSVTINKSISIVNDGVGEAGVTVTSHTDAIDVSIGANDVVNLRGLTLVGGGVGTYGILFSNLGALNIQNCAVRGFFDGIEVVPAGTAALNVSDTIVSNITATGIAVQPVGGGTVAAAFNRVQTIGASNTGFLMDGSGATGALNVTIANSAATNNVNTGVAAQSLTGKALTQLMVSNSVVSNNGTGIFETGANSTTYLAQTKLAGNTTAFTVTNNGALFSFDDNDVKSNGTDGGVISLVSTK